MARKKAAKVHVPQKYVLLKRHWFAPDDVLYKVNREGTVVPAEFCVKGVLPKDAKILKRAVPVVDMTEEEAEVEFEEPETLSEMAKAGLEPGIAKRKG